MTQVEEVKTFYNEEINLAYVAIYDLHDIDYLSEEINAYGLLDCDFKGGYESFLKSLKDFENKKKYHFEVNPNKKWRYGMMFSVLLPHGKIDIQTKKVIVKKFVSQLRGNERLNYLAYEFIKGKGRYIKIFLSEREYHQEFTVRYNRDYWHDEITGHPRKKGDEGAIRTVKKGDIKKIISNTFSDTKTRMFTGTSDARMKKWLQIREIWTSILANQNLVFKSKFIFKRKKYSNLTNRFVKINNQNINWLMTNMENDLARAYEECISYKPSLKDIASGIGDELRYVSDKEVHKDPFSFGFIGNASYKKLIGLYHKMAKRFEKNSFHFNNIEYRLTGMPSDVYVAITRLKSMFKEELLMCMAQP